MARNGVLGAGFANEEIVHVGLLALKQDDGEVALVHLGEDVGGVAEARGVALACAGGSGGGGGIGGVG